MSKNSQKQLYAQLMEWLPTLKSYQGRHKKRAQSRMKWMKEQRGM